MRVAFCGASGTGKSELARYIAEKHGLPINPVGSRSVAKAMGFASPYDVDAAGKRAEFQSRLLIEKSTWELEHDAFVTDRTTLDNLAYTLIHGVDTIDDAYFDAACSAMGRYDHVIYCAEHLFCNPGEDPARMKSKTYHRLFDAVLWGLLSKHQARTLLTLRTVPMGGLEARYAWLDRIVGRPVRR